MSRPHPYFATTHSVKGKRISIKGVQWLPEFKHHVVGGIDNIIN